MDEESGRTGGWLEALLLVEFPNDLYSEWDVKMGLGGRLCCVGMGGLACEGCDVEAIVALRKEFCAVKSAFVASKVLIRHRSCAISRSSSSI